MTKLEFVSVKLASWPARDRHMWTIAKQLRDPLNRQAIAGRWSPDTIRLTEEAYGLYLGWLAAHGQIDDDLRPIDRIDRNRASAFVEAYWQGRAASTVTLAVRGVAYLIRACHPPDGLPWLTRSAHALASRAEPERSKALRMATVDELLQLGFALMTTGKRDLDIGLRQGARIFRDGLMICALVMRPVRRRNFAELEIGRTLIVEPGNIRAAFRKTKTGSPIEFAYPECLQAAFAFYLTSARPVLLSAVAASDSAMLWIGRCGRPMDRDQVGKRIGAITKRHLGRRVSPHLFRDCVATHIAIFDPTHISIVKQILGHKTLAASEKHYNHAGSCQAASRMRDLVVRMRTVEESSLSDGRLSLPARHRSARG